MNHLTQLLYSVLYNQPDMQNAFLVLTLTGLASIKSFDQICFLGFYIININFRCLRARSGNSDGSPGYGTTSFGIRP